MSVRVRSINRTGKPEGQVRVDRGHHLGKYLVGGWLFNEASARFSDVTGFKLQDLSNSGTDVTVITKPIGKAVNIPSGATAILSALGLLESTPIYMTGQDSWTVIFSGVLNGPAAGFRSALQVGRWDQNAGLGGIFKDNSTSACQVWQNNTLRASSATRFFDFDEQATWAVVRDGAVYTFYKNADLSNQVTSAHTAVIPYSATYDHVYVGSSVGSFDWNGTLDYMYVFNRPFSAADIREMYRDPYRIFRPRRRANFFVPIAGLITQTVTATASGIAARGQTTILTAKEATATGAAAVQKTIFKTAQAVASGVANVASTVISGVTQVTVTAVAVGVPAVGRTIFKTVRATAAGIAGAVGSTGAVLLQTVAAVAQGIAKRQVMVLKTVKDVAPAPVIVTSVESFSSASGSFGMTMPRDAPDDSLYIFVVAMDDGIFTPLTPPSEITLVDSRAQIESQIWVGYRVGDNEPTFYSFTSTGNQFTGQLPTWRGLVIQISGANTDDPIDGTRNNAGSNPITQAVTPTVENPLILSFNEGPGGEYTSSDPTTISLGDTDGLISLAAAFETGAKDVNPGSTNFSHTSSTITFIGQMTVIAPSQGHKGPTATGIVTVLSQIFIKINPFSGAGGLGFVDRVRGGWRRRRSTWRRRR